MNVDFDTSFNRAIKKIKDKSVLSDIKDAIIDCEEASLKSKIKGLKKLVGYKTFYRIKIPKDYRIGVEIEGNTITFITVLHRKDIYKKFP